MQYYNNTKRLKTINKPTHIQLDNLAKSMCFLLLMDDIKTHK